MALYIASQWREIAGYFKTGGPVMDAGRVKRIFIIIGILVAINYIGKRENKRWGLTDEQAIQPLRPEPELCVQTGRSAQHPRFHGGHQASAAFRDQLKEYEYASKQVKAECVNPDRNPAAAQQYKVDQYGTIVFEYKGRTKHVTSNAEQDITNAIVKVVSGQQEEPYSTDGHGEKDTASDGTRRLRDNCPGAWGARTTPPTSSCSPKRDRYPTTRRWW